MIRSKTTLSILTAAGVALAVTTASQAATIFDVSDTAANGGALNGDTGGTTTALTLGAADGGGTINLTSDAVNQGGATNLTINNGTMGTSNEKWGTGAFWTFKFDQQVSFDGFTFDTSIGNNTPFDLTSSAWVSTAADDESGTGWSFDGASGTFSFNAYNNGGVIDFSSASVPNVDANTQITLSVEGVNGAGMTSFTITPATVIPEPASLAMGLMGLTLIAARRRR